jgi:deferrochelatase/peroxidase EfeB
MVLVWVAAIAMQAKEVRLEVSHRRFAAARVALPPGYSLRLVNRDAEIYTIESPGAFEGDVMLRGGAEAVVKPRRGGEFVAMIEEQPDSEVALSVAADPNAPRSTEAPFDLAKERGLQPLDQGSAEPAYGAMTTFNLRVRGQAARQHVLLDLYRLAEELAMDAPPPEVAAYFQAGEWARLRPSVAMVVGLGATAYSLTRFGQGVASSKPPGLRSVPRAEELGLSRLEHGQRDVLVRVTSDSAWFNLRVCRLVWRRLLGRISDQRLEAGYANPNGRSPILGGFYDGTGNPSGVEREKAIYGSGGLAMVALYRIRFDEEKFLSFSLAKREGTVGREQDSGRPLKKPDVWAHKVRTNDGKNNIVRMPLVFDDGVGADGVSETGLLFLAAARSFEPLEALLGRMLAGREGYRDRLLELMHFEEAGYYVIPPSPRGSYPGSLRAPFVPAQVSGS